jgi:hypothetical protein
MLKDKTYFSKSNTITTVPLKRELGYYGRTLENTSLELYCIKVRELDKRYTYANPKQGKCKMNSCQNNATHWLILNPVRVDYLKPPPKSPKSGGLKEMRSRSGVFCRS